MAIICCVDNIDLNLLPVFAAVMAQRSVGRAAEQLGMSQPGLSYALKRLRRHFGDPLFIRTRGGMAPTAMAVQVAPPIEQMLRQVRDHLVPAAPFDPRHSAKVFTLAMSDLGDLIVLPKLQRALTRAGPGIGIRVRALSGADATAALESGQVDLAIGYLPESKRADIFQQRLYKHGFVCIARTGHPRVTPTLDREEFLSLQHANVSHSGHGSGLLEHMFARYRMHVRPQLQIPSILSLPFVVAATDYVAIVPVAVAELFGAMVEIQTFEPPVALPQVTVRQCWHRRNHAEAGNRWLRELIGTLFRGRDGWRLN